MKYGLEDKYRAATAYVTTGSYASSSRQTKIPESTIRSWAQDDEFQAMCREMRAEFGDEIKVGMAHVVRDGIEQIRDRVRNGDFIQDKDGNLKRKPMTGRDLTIATGTMFDKLRISEGLPTQIVKQENRVNIDARKLMELRQRALVKNGDEPLSEIEEAEFVEKASVRLMDLRGVGDG